MLSMWAVEPRGEEDWSTWPTFWKHPAWGQDDSGCLISMPYRQEGAY